MDRLAIAKVFKDGNNLILLGEENILKNYIDDLYEENCLLDDVKFDKNEFADKCEYCETSLMESGDVEGCPILVTSYEVNLNQEECDDLLQDYKKDMPWADVITVL